MAVKAISLFMVLLILNLVSPFRRAHDNCYGVIVVGTDLVRLRERSVGKRGIGETWNAELE